MVDYAELMHILSTPRPNGSPALKQTLVKLQGWLDQRAIPYRLHTFRLYPYFFIAIGAWLILSRLLLAIAVWLRLGWGTLVIALVGLPGGLVDEFLDIPLISWPGAGPGINLLLEFGPANASQEIVLSAHYDSKTELLDHRQRLFFLRLLPVGILLSILLGLLGPIDRWLLTQESRWADFTYGLGILLSLILLFLACGLGINLALGGLRSPSQGAVDNGAACAILLGLAESAASGALALQHTRLTITLFTGEEVNMQGSRAYTRSRQWPLPTLALNLEVMAQNGDYVYWEQDGAVSKLVPTTPAVCQAIAESVAAVTGKAARPAGPLNSDGYSFLRHGVPATTLGTYDTTWVDRGFHGPTDNLERVVLNRLPEGVNILAHFVQCFDDQQIPFPGGAL